MSGPSRKEAAGRKGGYTSLNLHHSYKGNRTDGNKPFSKGHGLQSLGKVTATSRRMPVPASLPSLKSENAGNDPTINLVPSGGGGWKKDADKENQAEEVAQSRPVAEEAQKQHRKPSTPTSPGGRFKSDFPSLGEQEAVSRKESEERDRKQKEGERDGERDRSPDRNSRPPGDRGWRDARPPPLHGHAPPGPPQMAPYPHGPYPPHHGYHPYMMPPGPHRHGVPPPYGGHPMAGPGGHYPPPPQGPYHRPPYPPHGYSPHNPYEMDPYHLPPRKDEEDVSRPPTVKADDLKSMELLEEDEGGWAGHHDEVDYTKEVIFEDSSDDESSSGPDKPKRHRGKRLSDGGSGRRRGDSKQTGRPKALGEEQQREGEHKEKGDREENYEREKGKDSRRTDRGRGEGLIPDGPRHAPPYPPYPYPYPPYDYGYHMYPPPHNQGPPYPVQHGYPPRYGPQFRERDRKRGPPSDRDRDDPHGRHDFHAWIDHRPKRKGSSGEEERASEKPPRILTKSDRAKDSQRTGDSRDEVFADLGEGRGRPSSAIKRVDSSSLEAVDSSRHHVTFASDQEELPHSPVDSLPSSHTAPKMRSHPKKIVMRKMGEESLSESHDQPPSGAAKTPKDRPKDLHPVQTGDSKSGEGSQDSKPPDSAGSGAKVKQTAWNVNERGPITSPMTLYEPEGKRSAEKFLRYQHASREPGPKDRNKEGGEKDERKVQSPSALAGEVKVLPKEGHEKDALAVEEAPSERRIQLASPTQDSGAGDEGGRGGEKGERQKDKPRRQDFGRKASYDKERPDSKERPARHRREDGRRERGGPRRLETDGQDHEDWEPQPRDKESEREKAEPRKPVESVGRGRGVRGKVLQENREFSRQQEPGRGRGRDRGSDRRRQEGSLPRDRDRRKRDFQEGPREPSHDHAGSDQREKLRADKSDIRSKKDENRRRLPSREQEGGRQGGGRHRGEGQRESQAEQPQAGPSASEEAKRNAQPSPVTTAAQPISTQPQVVTSVPRPSPVGEQPKQSILGEPPGKSFAEMQAEAAGTQFPRQTRKALPPHQIPDFSKTVLEGQVHTAEELGEQRSDRRRPRGDEKDGRRGDRPRAGGGPPHQREGTQRPDRDQDRGEKGGRRFQRDRDRGDRGDRDRSERGPRPFSKHPKGDHERERQEVGDRRSHAKGSAQSTRDQQPPERSGNPPRERGETPDNPTVASGHQAAERPRQSAPQPQKPKERKEVKVSLGYTGLEDVDSDWEDEGLQLEQELDKDEEKAPLSSSEKQSQDKDPRLKRSGQSYPRGATRVDRGGGPQRKQPRRERGEQGSSAKDGPIPSGRGRTDDSRGRRDRRAGDASARPGGYRRQRAKDGHQVDGRPGNRQQTPLEGLGGLDSFDTAPQKDKSTEDKRAADFEKFDLNSSKVFIVDEIGSENLEPGRFSPSSQGEFVEVTSKKERKEKIKKEKEEQQRRAEEESRRQHEERQRRNKKMATSRLPQGSSRQAWTVASPGTWTTGGSGAASWPSTLLVDPIGFVPQSPLKQADQLTWLLDSHNASSPNIGVIGDNLQTKPQFSATGSDPLLLTSSAQNTDYCLFGSSVPTVTPFVPTMLTPSGHMLDTAVSMALSVPGKEPYPLEETNTVAETSPEAMAAPAGVEPLVGEVTDEKVVDKASGQEVKKPVKVRSSVAPRFQQGRQQSAGRGRGTARGGDRRERDSKPVGGNKQEKVPNAKLYMPPHQRGDREPSKGQRSSEGGSNERARQTQGGKSSASKAESQPGSSKPSKVATLRTDPTPCSSPCDAGTGDPASPANADPVAHPAGDQQPLRAGSSAAEATKPFLTPLPVEGQVKQVTVEEEVGVHITSNARSHDHVSVDQRTNDAHAVSDGVKFGKGGGGVSGKSSAAGVKQPGNTVSTKTITPSSSTGGVKTISYAQALKSFVSSPDQAPLAGNLRSHAIFDSSFTNDTKDRSNASSRSSTPQVNRPISNLDPKERANVVLQVPSECSSRTHSALSNLADVSSESGQNEGVQAPRTSGARSHPPTPDMGKPRAAIIGESQSQPFPSSEISCGLSRLGDGGAIEQRSVGSPSCSQEASLLEHKPEVASSVEPAVVTKAVPNSATKVPLKHPSLPPGFSTHSSPQHPSLPPGFSTHSSPQHNNLQLGPQPLAAAQHVTVFPQAVSDITSDASQPFGKKQGNTLTSLHSGGAPPSNPHDSKAQTQFPTQTPFRSAELRTLDQAVQDESLHAQRLQIQQALPHYEPQKGAFVTAHSAISHFNQGLPQPHQHINTAPPLGTASKPLITQEHPSEGQPRLIDSQSPASAAGIIHSPRAVKPSPVSMPTPPPGLVASFASPVASLSAGMKDATSGVQSHSSSAFSLYQKSHPHPVSLPPCNSPRDHRPVGELVETDRQGTSEEGEARASTQDPLSGSGDDSESSKPSTSLSITAPPFVPSGTQTPVSHSTPTSGFVTPYSMPDLVPSGFPPYPVQHFKNSVVSAIHETGGNGLHVTPRQPPGFDRPVLPAVPTHHIPPVVLDPVRFQMIQRAQAAAVHAQAMAGLTPSPGLIKQLPHLGIPSPEALALLHQLALSQQLQQQYPPHTRPPPPNPTAVQRKSLQHVVTTNPAMLQRLHSEAMPPSAVQVIMPQAVEPPMMMPHKNHEQAPPGLPVKDVSQVRKPAHPYIAEYPGILAMAPTSGMQTRSLLPNTHPSVPPATLAPYTVRGGSAHDIAILPPPDQALATQALLMQPKVTPISKRRPLLPTPPALSMMSSSSPFSARLPVPPQGLQVPFPMAQDQQRSNSLYAFNPAGQY